MDTPFSSPLGIAELNPLRTQMHSFFSWAPTVYWEFESQVPVVINSVHYSAGYLDSVISLPIAVTQGTANVVSGVIGNGVGIPTSGGTQIFTLHVSQLITPLTAGASISFWFNISAIGSGSGNVQVEYDGDIIQFVGLINAAGQLVMSITPPTVTTTSHTVTPSLSTWHLCVMTYNQSNGDCGFWVDNALTTINNGAPVVDTSTFGDAAISGNNVGTNPNTVIDEFGIWVNTVLNSTEVGLLWNGGSAARPPL